MVEEGSMVLLGELEESRLKELLGSVTLITDPLGQELIQKAARPNSPIDVD